MSGISKERQGEIALEFLKKQVKKGIKTSDQIKRELSDLEVDMDSSEVYLFINELDMCQLGLG